ncbi:hypothetical protein FKM82_025599 [Ascaphus truei]
MLLWWERVNQANNKGIMPGWLTLDLVGTEGVKLYGHHNAMFSPTLSLLYPFCSSEASCSTVNVCKMCQLSLQHKGELLAPS